MSDSATLQTVAHQALLSVGFSRQEHWSGLLCPPPGGRPDLVIEPASFMSLALVGGFFSTSATWEAPPLWFSSLKGLPVYFPPVYSEGKHQTIPN